MISDQKQILVDNLATIENFRSPILQQPKNDNHHASVAIKNLSIATMSFPSPTPPFFSFFISPPNGN
jgi:hypothetical protein